LADANRLAVARGCAENRTINSRTAVFTFGLPIVRVVGLLAIAKLNQFGDFATSPQTARLHLGGSAVVAGGKAQLSFVEAMGEASVEISCKEETRVVPLDDQPSDSVCGVRVRLKTLDMESIPPRSEIEVTW